MNSFLWSDDSSNDEELDEPEDVMAGIEVAFYGVRIRPFIFFQGHAELMGHIWAGTASEKTPIIRVGRLSNSLDIKFGFSRRGGRRSLNDLFFSCAAAAHAIPNVKTREWWPGESP